MDLSLRVVHVVFAAAWFGHKLLVPGDLKTALAGGQEELVDLVPRLNRAERMGQVTGLGTLLSGLSVAAWLGFDSVEPQVFVGLGLVVLAIAIGATIARPASNNLRSAVAGGDRTGAAVAGRQIRRVLAAESLLWAVTLVLMLA